MFSESGYASNASKTNLKSRQFEREVSVARNIQVVLIAEPQPSVAFLVNSLNDAEVYQTVAKKYDIPLIENVFSKYLSEYKYKSDTIHLNSEGYELVAEDVAKELKSFGLID